MENRNFFLQDKVRLTLLLLVLTAGCPVSRAAEKKDAPPATPTDDREWLVYPDGLPDAASVKRFNIEACNALSLQRKDPASKEEWESKKETLHTQLRRAMGLDPWPEKTPLNARVTGRAERDGYTIENVVFESLPRLYVPANVYKPKGAKEPLPAIVVAMGHSMEQSKNGEVYRLAQLGLMRQGFLVLAYDPIGQGERRLPPYAHGVAWPAFMVGKTALTFPAWDTIRAIDYLESRPDVDPKRLGLTGTSGGGLNTLYVSPIEPRVAAAASFCCTDEFYAWIKDGGRHCICNHQIGIAPLMEQFEMVGLVAPRPYLAGNGIQDKIFPIAGVRRTMTRAQKIYAFYGLSHRIRLVEADEPHSWAQPLRESAYGWFSLHLLGRGDGSPIPETPVELEPWNSPDLMAFKNGMPADAETPVTIIRREAKRLVGGYPSPPKDAEAHKAWAGKTRAALWETLGGEPKGFTPTAKLVGAFEWEGRRVERLAIQTEPTFEVGALFIHPEKAKKKTPAVIYLHDEGKIQARTSPSVRGLLERGIAVLALDARCLGESESRKDFSKTVEAYTDAIVLGRPIPAQQAWDIICAARVLAGRKDVERTRIAAYGEGRIAAIVTLAGALSDDFAAVTAEGGVCSFVQAIDNDFPGTGSKYEADKWPHWLYAPNILKRADLPQIIGSQAPRPFLAVNPIGDGKLPVSAEEAAKSLAFAKVCFRARGKEKAFVLQISETPADEVVSFLSGVLLRRK